MCRINRGMCAIILLLQPAFIYARQATFAAFEVQPGLDNVILIRWKVAAGKDTLYYRVQRSTDSTEWSTITHISTQAGSLHEYSYKDANPGQGINYYRVQQITAGRIISSSTVKWVQVNRINKLYLWPNPAKNVVHIRTPFVKGSMLLSDAAGNFILRVEITNTITDIYTGNLAAGAYVLQIRNGNQVLTEKFVKE